MDTKVCLLLVLFCLIGSALAGSSSKKDSCGYPYTDSSKPLAAATFSASVSLAAFSPTNGGVAFTGSSVKLWYTSSSALTLGVRQVITVAKDGSKTTTDFTVQPFLPSSGATASNAQSPAVGSEDAVDSKGRPIYPALYVTDITDNSKDTSGDWQSGVGKPNKPSAIYGTWKAAVLTINIQKGTTTVTPDSDPKKNSDLAGGDPVPSGTSTGNYVTELVWYTSQLGLTAGRTYRFQFLLHGGSAADAGETCSTASVSDPNAGSSVAPSSVPVSGKKITICHVPPGNPLNAHPITISLNAWKVKDGVDVTSSDLKDCYVHTDSADDNPGKHGHCPGGHGGDYVLEDPDGSCITPADRPTCFDLCNAATAAAQSAGITDESQERNACDTNPKGKIDICHVPPGNTGKFLQLSISCNAWKTCKPNDENGFHCPGGHGGDFAGSSCGIPYNTPLYNTFCAPSKTICYVPTGNASPKTMTISPCAWNTDDGNCKNGEYGPLCHGGDFEGNCPVPPACPSLSHVIWSPPSAVGTGVPSCFCDDPFLGTCTQNGGVWTCNCNDCAFKCTAPGGTCTDDGVCQCADGYVADGGGGCKRSPTDPSTDTCTDILSPPFDTFNVVLFGNARLRKSDIEGSLFVNNGLSVKDYSIGAGGDGSTCGTCSETDLALYVGGSVSDGNVAVCSGDAWYGSLNGGTISAGSCEIQNPPSPDEFRAALQIQASNVRSISSKFSTLPATDKSNGRSVISLTADSNTFQLFSIDCKDLSDAKRIKVSGLTDPSSTTVVFNVDGSQCSTVDLTSVGFDDPLPAWSSSIVWNFPKTKLLLLDDVDVPGMILAPYATIDTSSGSAISGQVIAQNLRGRVQVHNDFFTGCLKTDLTGVTGECQNTCDNGEKPTDTVTCTCPCSSAPTCSGSNVLDSTICQCVCNEVNDCPLGSKPDDDCTGCKSCGSIGNDEVWLNAGSCDFIKKPSCSSPKNIFGEASKFAVYILSGGFYSRNNHVGGRIAANGDIDLFNYLVGDELFPNAEQGKACSVDNPVFTLVAAKQCSFPSNGQVLSGSIASGDIGANVGPTLRNSLSSGCTATIPFANAGLKFKIEDFRSLSSKLSKLKITGKNTIKNEDKNVWVFTGDTGSSGDDLEVFDVSPGQAKQLFATGFWELNNVASRATIVVNINGDVDTVGFNQLDMSAWEKWSTRTVFNFPSASNIVINGVSVQGSILAPEATISANNGKVVGQIIVGKWAPNTGATNGVYVKWLGGFNGCVSGL